MRKQGRNSCWIIHGTWTTVWTDVPSQSRRWEQKFVFVYKLSRAVQTMEHIIFFIHFYFIFTNFCLYLILICFFWGNVFGFKVLCTLKRVSIHPFGPTNPLDQSQIPLGGSGFRSCSPNCFEFDPTRLILNFFCIKSSLDFWHFWRVWYYIP